MSLNAINVDDETFLELPRKGSGGQMKGNSPVQMMIAHIVIEPITSVRSRHIVCEQQRPLLVTRNGSSSDRQIWAYQRNLVDVDVHYQWKFMHHGACPGLPSNWDTQERTPYLPSELNHHSYSLINEMKETSYERKSCMSKPIPFLRTI